MATGFTSGLRGNADIISISEPASSPAQAPPDVINSKPAMLDNARHFIHGPSGSTGFGQTRAKLGPTEVNTHRRELSGASLMKGCLNGQVRPGSPLWAKRVSLWACAGRP